MKTVVDPGDKDTPAVLGAELPKGITSWYTSSVNKVLTHEYNHPVLYGFIDSHLRSYKYLCHRYLADMETKRTRLVFHMFTNQITPEQIRYIDYLCSFDNPYEALADHTTLVKSKVGVSNMVVFDWETVPSKLCVNFLEASRLGSCWGLAELWCYLVDNGVNRDIALALIVYFHWNSQTVTYNTPLSRIGPKPYEHEELFSVCNTWSNDQPFNSCVTNNQDYTKVGQYFRIDKFLRRDPSTLKAQDEPQPCNHIWDRKVKKSMFATETSKNNKTLNTIKDCYTKEQPLPEGMADYINKTLFEGGQLD